MLTPREKASILDYITRIEEEIVMLEHSIGVLDSRKQGLESRIKLLSESLGESE